MNTAYLTFRLRELQYGIEVAQVREIFPLPELQQVPEAPGDIIGLLNLRGKLIPVMHLGRRLSQPLQPCRVTDSVIVVEVQGLQVGVVVHQVDEVCPIESAQISADLSYGRESHVNTAFLSGVATVEETLYLLVNPDALVRLADEVAAMVWQAQLQNLQDVNLSPDQAGAEAALDAVGAAETALASGAPEPSGVGTFFEQFCPDSTAAEQALFRKRAADLRQPLVDDSKRDLIPLAVVLLEGEFFGVDMTAVREFVAVRNVCAVPCCPAHVVGNMNLRGEVVTLIDIRAALNLPQASSRPPSKAMIAEAGDVVAGITVEDVCDILYLNPADITGLPAAAGKGSGCLQGTVPYQSTLLRVLDVLKLLAAEQLIVQ